MANAASRENKDIRDDIAYNGTMSMILTTILLALPYVSALTMTQSKGHTTRTVVKWVYDSSWVGYVVSETKITAPLYQVGYTLSWRKTP